VAKIKGNVFPFAVASTAELEHLGKHYPDGRGAGNELLTELVAAEPAPVSEWSERTRSELKAAISEDRLTQNGIAFA
jgi:hypothetical protein